MTSVTLASQEIFNTNRPFIRLVSPQQKNEVWPLPVSFSAENDTLSLRQSTSSSVSVSLQAKAGFHSPARPSERALHFPATWWPFPTRDPPPLFLFYHYRHHCPQNGWQLLEIPGCVTTLRCTRCAICVAPVLMPQQLEMERMTIPAAAQVAN